MCDPAGETTIENRGTDMAKGAEGEEGAGRGEDAVGVINDDVGVRRDAHGFARIGEDLGTGNHVFKTQLVRAGDLVKVKVAGAGNVCSEPVCAGIAWRARHVPTGIKNGDGGRIKRVELGGGKGKGA